MGSNTEKSQYSKLMQKFLSQSWMSDKYNRENLKRNIEKHQQPFQIWGASILFLPSLL